MVWLNGLINAYLLVYNACLSVVPDCDVEEVIGEVLAGICFLPTQLGFELYVLTFK